MKQTNWWMLATLILLVAALCVIFSQVINVDKQSTDMTVPKIAGIYIPTNSTDYYALAVFDLKDKRQLDVFNNLTIKFMELARDKI